MYSSYQEIIYKMDYGKMLEYHAEKQADATIAVIEVSWAEAGRFGILHTNDKMEDYKLRGRSRNIQRAICINGC